MSEKVLQDVDALAHLEQLAKENNGQLTDAKKPEPTSAPAQKSNVTHDENVTDVTPIELPAGYEFIPDMKQRHMLTFWEENQKGKDRYESRFGVNQNTLEAAIKAGWFARPIDFTGDVTPKWDYIVDIVGNLDWGEEEQIANAVIFRFNETLRTPKN